MIQDFQEDFYQQGLAKAKAGDRYGAVQAFSCAIAANAQLAEAYYQRGLVLFDLSDRQGAIADYDQALSLKPDAIDVYIARSITRIAINDIVAAQSDIAQALVINPKSAITHQLLGLTYKQQNQIEKAIATYKKAASLFLELKDEDNCRRCIESYKPLEAMLPPSTADIFANVQQKIDKSEYINALIDLNWMLQIEPKNVKAFCLRGLTLGKLGDPEAAIKDLNQATFLEPQNIEVRISRGRIRLEIGDAQGAIADFNELLREYPSMAEIYSDRAKAHLKLKDYRTAIEDFSRSLSLNNKSPQLYCDRAEARYEFGDLKGAIDDYQLAANIWFNQSNMDRYRYALDRVNLWQSELEKQTKEGKRQLANAAATVDLMQMPSLELQQRLLGLVGGNMAIAQRLIDIAKQDHPNMPEVWYWQKVIFDLESDQRPRN
ncbi:MAG: tetratricopeptide repeat protein [Pseudanabaena sp.]|jgi:tetratricopeptide (TPR) repeat protein|nr:tetratricopeptide repeat protein [Pseudanabaena sp. M090S1SP2A07QC]MCA6505465.1 tetratricopeptide repeat protein [Pseudanabaena sp. M172S2SP2A07QC]MCA6523324.1 tetratricopeptide repeat protein [Pseudanabaena sp. M051S1SP2A07QC]MCA6526024.1 tetratricopeptide repeat protein [Pseudanabaena sp. M179S2SP2A07QC]MCA6529024.1 tetratricopeptide repeat protein [Pseudanabaena sp. M125S2SP2A07QC]MCA6535367.1 tetratricopeptide repeat protein [Pseudanabaena sp. M176S2SP2A07QC]MCA6538034.1 tetratricopept